MRRSLFGACALAFATSFAADSAASFVFVNPDTSSFWRTARSGIVTVPVDFPDGASSATLSVVGVGYSTNYLIAVAGPYAFQLPVADAPETENTYKLTLSFDRGASKTATLSLIAGLESGGAGVTRCFSQGGSGWSRAKDRRMTLPVPHDTTSLTLNGEAVDTGLDGAQGFLTISALPASLALVTPEAAYLADITHIPGLLILFQ